MSKILSAFLDEAGQERNWEPEAKWYLLTLVLHDQDDDISVPVDAYERYIRSKGLPDIPFHMVELMHGRRSYEGVELADRKRLLMSFNALVQRLPIRYHTFAYRRSEFYDYHMLSDRMKRDLKSFIGDHLAEFQEFDTVAIYYDGGQSAVTQAVHGAFDEALSANTAEYKRLRFQERRLSQVADYLCSIELADLRFMDGDVSATYERVYGSRRMFRANYLKQARRKRLD